MMALLHTSPSHRDTLYTRCFARLAIPSTSQPRSPISQLLGYPTSLYLHILFKPKMVIQSTNMCDHQSLARPKGDSVLSSGPSAVLVNSYPTIGLSLVDPFAANLISIGDRSPADLFSDDHYGNAPCDGDTVWYCSSCGDGPMASWNPCCANCGHACCGACPVEPVK